MNCRNCTYSLSRPGQEQLESFIWNTGAHVLIASTVNGFFLYLMGKEDILPGILVGASAGLSQNFSHKTAHALTIRRRESCHLPFALEMIIAAALTYQIAKTLLQIFEYELGKREILKFQSMGMIVIALYHRSQKPEEG